MWIELRERTEEEVRTYFARTRDPDIQAVLPQTSRTVEQALEAYRQSLAPGSASYGRTIWAEGTYVGDIWCYGIHQELDPDAMLSFCIFAKERWGQGIATQALRQFLAGIVPRFGLRRIGAFLYEDNAASCRVLEKAGFALQERWIEEGRASLYCIYTAPKEENAMTFTQESNRIFCERDGKTLAEVTFPEAGPGVVVIDHTWVDGALRGQGAGGGGGGGGAPPHGGGAAGGGGAGAAGQLMQAVVELLRADGRKARATCSYARAWLAKHPEAADVLAPDWCDGPEACRLRF